MSGLGLKSCFAPLVLMWAIASTGACSPVDGEAQSAKDTDTTVVLVAESPFTSTERYEIEQQGIQVAEYLGDNRYLGLVEGQQDLTELADRLKSLSEISKLDPMLKVDASIFSDDLPDYARAGGQVIAQISFFPSSKEEESSILEPYFNKIEYDENSGTWLVTAKPDELSKFAEKGRVRRIEIAADPKLLEDDPFLQNLPPGEKD